MSVFRNINGQQTEKHKEIIQKMQSEKSYYLDVTLNLNDGTYRPFNKPNEKTTYILVKFDHPPQIIQKIPRLIGKRLSCLSSIKETFENSKDYFEHPLRQCRYKRKSNYTKENEEINKKSRECDIFSFSPPYSKSVKH